MSKLTLAALALLAFAPACGSSAPEPQTPPPSPPVDVAPTAAPDATPAAAPAPALDLGTPEKARAAIYDALVRDDKEGFKKLVSKRMIERHGPKFDAWYAVWKSAADKGPREKFDKIAVTQEDGVYKLDEN